MREDAFVGGWTAGGIEVNLNGKGVLDWHAHSLPRNVQIFGRHNSTFRSVANGKSFGNPTLMRELGNDKR